MKLIRLTFLFLAVCLPTTWTLAHAEDAPPAADAAKDAKPKKKGKKKKAEEPKKEDADKK